MPAILTTFGRIIALSAWTPLNTGGVQAITNKTLIGIFRIAGMTRSYKTPTGTGYRWSA